jgi:hypothetical protein
MFVGHFAPAFVAATHPKSPSLPTLFVAGQLVDWGFFIFALIGIEHLRIVPGFTAMNNMDLYHMPYTHSLAGAFVWAAGFALLIWLWQRNWTGAFIGGVVVLSHWFLDFLVHAPDMTLAGGAHKMGLGLWNHPATEMALEAALLLVSAALYLGATMAVAGKSRFAVPVLLILMVVVQVWNWFGPQPTEVSAELPLTALFAFGLFTTLAFWAGKSRMHIMH